MTDEPDRAPANASGLRSPPKKRGIVPAADDAAAMDVGSVPKRGIREALAFAAAGTAARETFLGDALPDPDTIADVTARVIGLHTATPTGVHPPIAIGLQASLGVAAAVIEHDAKAIARSTSRSDAFAVALTDAVISAKKTILSLAAATALALPVV